MSSLWNFKNLIGPKVSPSSESAAYLNSWRTKQARQRGRYEHVEKLRNNCLDGQLMDGVDRKNFSSKNPNSNNNNNSSNNNNSIDNININNSNNIDIKSEHLRIFFQANGIPSLERVLADGLWSTWNEQWLGEVVWLRLSVSKSLVWTYFLVRSSKSNPNS